MYNFYDTIRDGRTGLVIRHFFLLIVVGIICRDANLKALLYGVRIRYEACLRLARARAGNGRVFLFFPRDSERARTTELDPEGSVVGPALRFLGDRETVVGPDPLQAWARNDIGGDTHKTKSSAAEPRPVRSRVADCRSVRTRIHGARQLVHSQRMQREEGEMVTVTAADW